MRNRKPTKPKPASTPLGRRLIRGLTELIQAVEGQPGAPKLTVRTVSLPPAPARYEAAQVRATRDRLNLSQAVFARLLGVSTVQVASWEQGVRKPSKLACRLLDEVNRQPQHWLDMASPSARVA